MTGSFLAAMLLGTKPAINVSMVDKTIKMNALVMVNTAKLLTPTNLLMIKFTGMFKRRANPMPNIPEPKPIKIVSALNILEISFLRAPKLLMIPISFVLSTTET